MSDQEMQSESQAVKTSEPELEAAPRPKRSGEPTKPRIPGVPAGKSSPPVQMRSSAPASAGVHDAAARGLASPTTALPFADTIQASFGSDHDVSKIQAHVGGDAAAAMGATAFASGDHVVFDQQPDLHTAAHEAAHVIQQAHGVNLYGGVGEAGDSYERHADEVADRVVAGKSAADLLGAPTASATPGAVQMKEKKLSDASEEAQRAQHDKAKTASISAITQAVALAATRTNAAANEVLETIRTMTAGGYSQQAETCRRVFKEVESNVTRLLKELESLPKESKAAPPKELVDGVRRLNGAYDRFARVWSNNATHYFEPTKEELATGARDTGEKLTQKPESIRQYLQPLNDSIGIDFALSGNHNPEIKGDGKDFAKAVDGVFASAIVGVRETALAMRMGTKKANDSVLDDELGRLVGHLEEIVGQLRTKATPVIVPKHHQKSLREALAQVHSLGKEISPTSAAGKRLLSFDVQLLVRKIEEKAD
jgi:hypothetical protein